MLSSSLFDYSDAVILACETVTVSNKTAAGADTKNRKNIIIKSWVPFTNCIIQINIHKQIMLKALTQEFQCIIY